MIQYPTGDIEPSNAVIMQVEDLCTIAARDSDQTHQGGKKKDVSGVEALLRAQRWGGINHSRGMMS